LKLDLSKAYDRVNWTFLRLVLLQVGLPLEAVDWIMSCVQTAIFAVFINGEPSKVFKGECGLRQGCSLSPLLFLLIVKGLSVLIRQAVVDGSIQGIKISDFVRVTHLLFVDDVLLMGKGMMEEWIQLKQTLDLFSNATRMLVNKEKSLFLVAEVDSNVRRSVQDIFSIRMDDLDCGFKYLGFFLNLRSHCGEVYIKKIYGGRY
jgi:hypothetical protein